MRALAILFIIATSLSTPACVGSTIHGLDEAAWFELLASGRPLPFSSGDKVDYDALSKLGPGAILFIAMRAGDAGDRALAAEMLGQAAVRESGRYRTRSVALLGEALLAAGDGSALVDLCQSPAGAELPPFRRSWLEASGLVLAGQYAQTAAAVEAMRSTFPAESARDAADMAAMALEAGYKAGRGRWADEFAALVAMDGSTRVYAALARSVALLSGTGADSAQAIRAVGARTFQLAEARSLVGSRDYGPAVVAFRRYVAGAENPETIAARLASAVVVPAATPAEPPIAVFPAEPATESAANALAGQEPAASENDAIPEDHAARPLTPEAAAGLLLTLPRSAASDAARAFIAASHDEGAAGFAAIVASTHNRGAEPARGYFDAYWHGRFLRAAERWQDAEAWFAKATGLAASASERDAAAWYAVEAAWKRSPASAIPALGKAMHASRNPLWFSDLIEPLSREALVARDGKALASLDAAIEGAAGARDMARLSYLCARAAQAGIITDADVAAAFGTAFGSAAAYAEARLRAAYAQKADDWYRVAAAYRLGEPLVEPFSAAPVQPALPAAAPPAEGDHSPASGGAQAPEAVGADEYALALARFGLGSRLRLELGEEYPSLSWDTVRSVAGSLAAAGRHEQALRLIATLFWKSAFTPARRDAELYWPRPWRETFSDAAGTAGLDEFLLYGLARSESAFDPAAVSKSGAVGLIQLMPATAEEMAGRLRLDSYELTDPVDNLALGSAYFARVLAGVGDRVLPAVFSYNGGPTRYRRWEAEYGNLPLDLLLEALSYAETRQYGRNVATAALSYAALYGEGDVRTYFAWLIGEGPKPSP